MTKKLDSVVKSAVSRDGRRKRVNKLLSDSGLNSTKCLPSQIQPERRKLVNDMKEKALCDLHQSMSPSSLLLLTAQGQRLGAVFFGKLCGTASSQNGKLCGQVR